MLHQQGGRGGRRRTCCPLSWGKQRGGVSRGRPEQKQWQERCAKRKTASPLYPSHLHQAQHSGKLGSLGAAGGAAEARPSAAAGQQHEGHGLHQLAERAVRSDCTTDFHSSGSRRQAATLHGLEGGSRRPPFTVATHPHISGRLQQLICMCPQASLASHPPPACMLSCWRCW